MTNTQAEDVSIPDIQFASHKPVAPDVSTERETRSSLNNFMKLNHCDNLQTVGVFLGGKAAGA